jgi:DNA-binding MarR family transcriptional regulator
MSDPSSIPPDSPAPQGPSGASPLPSPLPVPSPEALIASQTLADAPETHKLGEAPAGGPFYGQAGYPREDSVGYLMRAVMRLFVSEIDHRLEAVGLTNAQWGPLFMMHKYRSTTLAELSRELQTDPGALTRTLDRLEAKGLCRRERSTEDRRVVNLALTPDGEAAMAPVPGVLCEVMNSYLQGFSHAEWQSLLDFLRRMKANAEAVHSGQLPADTPCIEPAARPSAGAGSGD